MKRALNDLIFFFLSIWWMFAFLLSVYLCMSSIYCMWMRCKEDPVILSFSHKPMSIGEIPFPAVTICSLTKFPAQILNYTRVYRSMLKLDTDWTYPTKHEYYFEFYSVLNEFHVHFSLSFCWFSILNCSQFLI